MQVEAATQQDAQAERSFGMNDATRESFLIAKWATNQKKARLSTLSTVHH